MAYKIDFAKKASDEFSKLDGSIKVQIGKFLNKLANRDNPRTLGEPLQANLSAFWKYRIGNYRLVAEIQDDNFIVLMLAVMHRKEVYTQSAKRL